MNNSEKRYRVIISGGGTGGHIYPAVAIANELKRQHPESEILFVGALGKMEMTKVPDYGYNIVGLPIRGLQRKLTWENVLFPFRLISSYMKALKIISDFRPNAVVGTGGYASGPTVMAAQRKGIPVLIQEQNSYPGIANKRFAKKAKRICVAYEGMETYFDKEKLVVTGNPVRQDIMTTSQKRAEALEYYGLAEDKITILVLGGSLGARTINESVVKSLPEMLKADLQIVWQTGKIYYEEMIKRVEDITTAAVVVTRFIEKMDLAYAASDIIISRAGALSISEISIVGKPVIFVPSPNVAEDHQTKNAMALVSREAAIIVHDKDANDRLSEEVIRLSGDMKRRETLAENIKKLSKPNAVKDIIRELNMIMN